MADKHTFFEGPVFIQGNSMVVVVPVHCARYLGVMAGDTIEVRIMKVERKGKK